MPTPKENDWDKAERVCKDKRGVDKVKSNSLGYEFVDCKDGSGDYLP